MSPLEIIAADEAGLVALQALQAVHSRWETIRHHFTRSYDFFWGDVCALEDDRKRTLGIEESMKTLWAGRRSGHGHYAELADESDPRGPVVIHRANGEVAYTMGRAMYDAIRDCKPILKQG